MPMICSCAMKQVLSKTFHHFEEVSIELVPSVDDADGSVLVHGSLGD